MLVLRFRSHDLKHDKLAGGTLVAQCDDSSLAVSDEDPEDVDPGNEGGNRETVEGAPETNGAVERTGHYQLRIVGEAAANDLSKSKTDAIRTNNAVETSL